LAADQEQYSARDAYRIDLEVYWLTSQRLDPV